MGCKDKISDRCVNKTNAVCVKYEGTLHQDTALDANDCHNLEEVIEDINAELDDINTQIDVSELGDACIEYTPSGDELSVKDVLLEHEAQICALIEFTGVGDTEPCPTCIDPCDDSTTGCCSGGLVYYGYGEGEFGTTLEYNTWVAPQVVGYEQLIYNVTKDGIYKVTLDIGCALEDLAGSGYVGIGINNTDPAADPFSQYVITPEYNSKTFHFILTNVKKADVLRVKFKNNVSGVITINGVKVIIEKVG